jgi:hypothetical protein
MGGSFVNRYLKDIKCGPGCQPEGQKSGLEKIKESGAMAKVLDWKKTVGCEGVTPYEN